MTQRLRLRYINNTGVTHDDHNIFTIQATGFNVKKQLFWSLSVGQNKLEHLSRQARLILVNTTVDVPECDCGTLCYL
jgi:hypothetical protein